MHISLFYLSLHYDYLLPTCMAFRALARHVDNLVFRMSSSYCPLTSRNKWLDLTDHTTVRFKAHYRAVKSIARWTTIDGAHDAQRRP